MFSCPWSFGLRRLIPLSHDEYRSRHDLNLCELEWDVEVYGRFREKTHFVHFRRGRPVREHRDVLIFHRFQVIFVIYPLSSIEALWWTLDWFMILIFIIIINIIYVEIIWTYFQNIATVTRCIHSQSECMFNNGLTSYYPVT